MDPGLGILLKSSMVGMPCHTSKQVRRKKYMFEHYDLGFVLGDFVLCTMVNHHSTTPPCGYVLIFFQAF